MTRFRTIVLLLLATSSVAAFWFVRSLVEPSYRGHKITYWIEPWQHHNTEPAATVDAAFSEMDSRAIQWLMGELEWRPSGSTTFLNRLLQRLSIKIEDAPDRRERAALALGRIGARAKAAIPALERVVAAPVEPRGSIAEASARAALFRIREEPIESLTRVLTNGAAASQWYSASMTLAYLGPDAKDAVPYLAKGLALDQPAPIRAQAAIALKNIASSPDDCVPQLVACLESPEVWVQKEVKEALTAIQTPTPLGSK